MLSHIEIDSGDSTGIVQRDLQFFLAPVVLAIDTEIEIFRVTPRLRKVQLTECCTTFEQQIITVRTRVDRPQNIGVDVVLFGVAEANIQFPGQLSQAGFRNHENSLGSIDSRLTFRRSWYLLSRVPVASLVGSSSG